MEECAYLERRATLSLHHWSAGAIKLFLHAVHCLEMRSEDFRNMAVVSVVMVEVLSSASTLTSLLTTHAVL